MNVNCIERLPADSQALVILVHEPLKIAGAAIAQDSTAFRFLQQLSQRKEVACQVGKIQMFHDMPGSPYPLTVVVGGGKAEAFGPREAYRCAALASKTLANRPRSQVVFDFGKMPSDSARAAVVGAINGCHGQDLMRQERQIHPIGQLSWLGLDSTEAKWGAEVGHAMLLTRELVNLPPNVIYPESFAQRAAVVAQANQLEIEIWDELKLRRERCDSLLAVAAGSSRPPRLVVLRYPGKKKVKPLVVVGKGVTFDSGGLSIKPSDSMLTMKCDMAGAATVLGTLQAAARLQLEHPVVGLVGLVENMIGGSCYRLGDVLTARSGKTIEVHNTDAEGRLVLADVLDVALQEQPESLIDLATLTGACMVALGTDIAGLMSNDPALQGKLQLAAERAGEEVWPLPMSDHFSEQIRGKVADLKNVGEGRWAGAITAAKFLQEFVGTTPWVHVDIAGPAFFDSAKAFQDAGGTAVMLRSLVILIEALGASAK
jgi:leucyl aminopeptidase